MGVKAKDDRIPRIDRGADRLHRCHLRPKPRQCCADSRACDHIGQVHNAQPIQPAALAPALRCKAGAFGQ